MKKILSLLPYFLVLLIVAVRFLPHFPNATPVIAVALFAGVYLKRRWSIILPLAAMFLGDLFIGFYSWPIMLSVYGSFVLAGLLGWWLAKHKGVLNTVSAALIGSTLFFLITNWAVWQFGSLYPHNSTGLISCYAAALPFWRNMIIGDLFYVGVLFGGYELVLKLAKKRLFCKV